MLFEKLKKIDEDEKYILIEKLTKVAGVEVPSGLAKRLILNWNEIKR